MARLTIFRANAFEGYCNIFRVQCDGQQIGHIASNKTQSFEISNGTHVLKIRESAFGIKIAEPFSFNILDDEEKKLCLRYTSSIFAIKMKNFVIEEM